MASSSCGGGSRSGGLVRPSSMEKFLLSLVAFLAFASDIFPRHRSTIVQAIELNGGRPIERTIHVRYGYFPEPRPVHVACARGWLDMYDVPALTYYKVSCHPQSSGRYAAARLDNGQLHLAHLGSTRKFEKTFVSPCSMAVAQFTP
jgi:hypothetical protein